MTKTASAQTTYTYTYTANAFSYLSNTTPPPLRFQYSNANRLKFSITLNRKLTPSDGGNTSLVSGAYHDAAVIYWSMTDGVHFLDSTVLNAYYGGPADYGIQLTGDASGNVSRWKISGWIEDLNYLTLSDVDMYYFLTNGGFAGSSADECIYRACSRPDGSAGGSSQASSIPSNANLSNWKLTVNEPITITTRNLPNAVFRAPYRATLAAAHGIGTLNWTVATGSTLPTGFTLTNQGQLSSTGIPSAPSGVYTFTLSVTDSAGATAQQQFYLMIVSINIVNIRMKTNHLMEIASLRDFADQPRAVHVTVIGNGKEYPGVTQARASNDNLIDPAPLTFDLDGSHVPRFTDNVVLTVKLSTTLADGTSCDMSANLMILLPVVLVPGIDPLGGNSSMGGDGTFPLLEQYLKTQSDSLVYSLSSSLFGSGYRLSADFVYKQGYPTLYTLYYDRNNAKFSEAAKQFTLLVEIIKAKTHADKVNIATHSKGGLVARQYLVSSKGANVNRVILCQPPNLGSVWARDVPVQVYNYSNCYPVWNWYRTTLFGDFSPSSNPELEELNKLRLPPLTASQAYTILYSTNWKTPVTRTAQLGLHNAYTGFGDGDSIVPAFSQLGQIFDPNRPLSSLALIPAFQGVKMESPVMIPGNHIGYIETLPVMSKIYSILSQLPH